MLGLRDILIEQGRSQRWLAGRLGIHESLLSKWILGHRPMPLDAAQRAADLLLVPVDRILSSAPEFPDGNSSEHMGTAA